MLCQSWLLSLILAIAHHDPAVSSFLIHPPSVIRSHAHAAPPKSDEAFSIAPRPIPRSSTVQLEMSGGGPLSDFFRNLDNFIDDAMDRKLGGGSTFYGERKSSFSGSTKKSYADTARAEASKREVARDAMSSRRPAAGVVQVGAAGGTVRGEELRALIYEKWGERYPVLIKCRRDALGSQRLYLIVQWKYVGKGNLNLTEEEYVAESDAVAELLTEWGVANEVMNEIRESNAKPKTMTKQFPGLFIPLDVARDVVETW